MWPNSQTGRPPLVSCRDCLFDIFAATLHLGGISSFRNLRTRHAAVTWTHLSQSIFSTFEIFKCHGLTLVGLQEAELDNNKTVVVNCYDVGSPIEERWKNDIN
jgi:hypothetical protein